MQRNISQAAYQAYEVWEKFSWHTKGYNKLSSQALAIDVSGTIKTSANRDMIIGALAQTLGFPAGWSWEITLEWSARQTLLNEPSPTQVNVYAESP